MRDTHIRSHKQQFFSITVRPIAGLGYQATFTIYGGNRDAAEQGSSRARVDEGNPPRHFDTEQEAINAAEARACDWIDANPLKD